MSTETENPVNTTQFEALKKQLAELTARVAELEKHDAMEQEEIAKLRKVSDTDHGRLESLQGSNPPGPVGL